MEGQFSPVDNHEKPSESEFKMHLESLLHPNLPDQNSTEHVNGLESYSFSVPVLDDPINIDEINHVVEKQIKPNKGAGPDGVCPGIFRLLPDVWLSFLCLLMNLIFVCGYPLCWSAARLMMLFKKGDVLNCNNYRGISLINSSAKVYDYILNNRLMSWYIPFREQAGAQPKRGCIEHIISLRLIFYL